MPEPAQKKTNGQIPSFIFRGNAVAAAGFLNKVNQQPVELSHDVVTVHGESTLPVIGGVTMSKVEKPVLPFPEWISYDSCETFVAGTTEGDSKVTTLRASVQNVRVTTQPFPQDEAPGIKSVTFRADHLAISVRSVHPRKGEPVFEVTEKIVGKMSLTRTPIDGDPLELPIQLDFDDVLMDLGTRAAVQKQFRDDEEFFKRHAGASSKPLVFPQARIPQTKEGYFITSIVKGIHFDGQDIDGNVLTEPGFGAIHFGVILISGYNRRISLAKVSAGSEPGAEANFAGVDTNGLWGN